MECLQCKRVFGANEGRRAAIAIMVMGDEYIYSYWYCQACGVYSIEAYHDRFMGEDSITYMGPFPKEIGDQCAELISTCPAPQDKYCDCDAHKALYYGVPRN